MNLRSRTAAVLGALTMALTGAATPSQAADYPTTHFRVTISDGADEWHSGAQGAFTWYNRSVLVDWYMYLKNGECASVSFVALKADGSRITSGGRDDCNQYTSNWFQQSDISLNASSIVGGVRHIMVLVYDVNHRRDACIEYTRPTFKPRPASAQCKL
ncbi:hypothetical protein ACIBG8_10205 [Nonomuraea sp. NPDC050556]|uniref:hypothetical protein n=1 Tax=Nonomuraea sp. NPDC050556 TaxID=3364369 RepID=UPI00379C7D42